MKAVELREPDETPFQYHSDMDWCHRDHKLCRDYWGYVLRLLSLSTLSVAMACDTEGPTSFSISSVCDFTTLQSRIMQVEVKNGTLNELDSTRRGLSTLLVGQEKYDRGIEATTVNSFMTLASQLLVLQDATDHANRPRNHIYSSL